jgi:endonuclease-8
MLSLPYDLPPRQQKARVRQDIGVPEGDTVWNTARALHEALAGAEITRSDFRVPALATADLSGATVAESACRGKHLLLRLVLRDRPLTLHSHLRMDGSWRTYPHGARWTGGPAHLIRVALHTPTTTAVGYHLHELALVPTDREHTLVGHLGPDLLGPDWDPDEAVRRLQEQPDRTIGEALLDQRAVAGIGNMYRAETLFLRGVRPWTAVDQVTDLPRLLELARELMKSNLGRFSQVTTGDTRRGYQHWVYGRAGERCRRCGTRVERGSLGPTAQERIVYWCPSCQPPT